MAICDFRCEFRQPFGIVGVCEQRRRAEHRERRRFDRDDGLSGFRFARIWRALVFESYAEEITLAPDHAAFAPKIAERQLEVQWQDRQPWLVDAGPAICEISDFDITGVLARLLAEQ